MSSDASTLDLLGRPGFRASGKTGFMGAMEVHLRKAVFSTYKPARKA
jgi:hypothetical protein